MSARSRLRTSLALAIGVTALGLAAPATAQEKVLKVGVLRQWRRLLITSHPGADRAKRHGLRRGGWAPFDVGASGLIKGEPAAYLPRYDGCHLLYQRDAKLTT